MKRILMILAFALCASAAHAACSGSSPTWTAASASNTDIAACVTVASSGDTILVPANAGVSFSSAVTVSKCVTINGQGAVTVTSAADFVLNEQATCETRITGFTFTNAGGNPPSSDVIVNAASSTSGVRVDHNTFNASGTCIFIAVNSFGPVLFDHDTLTGGGASEMFHILGAGAGNTSGWTNTVVPGGPNMVFIEDSTFNNNVTSPILSVIESYYGAQTVMRHNTMNGNVQIDQHGTAGNVGARWFEFYDNAYYSQSTNQPSMITIRGGSGVIWGNTADGTNTHGSAGMINLYCENSGTWPQEFCPGSGYNGITTPHSNCTTTNSAPVQIWGNNSNMGISNSGGSSPVNLNRDYFSNTSQPSPIYWEESSSDTCSTTYAYTPYTYPNPLAGGAGQATAPTCSPTTGAVPQTVTCTNPNSGTTIMCYAASPTTPATNGAGTACTTGTHYTAALSITSPETLNIIAGTSTLLDSAVSSYTYTASGNVSFSPTALNFGTVALNSTGGPLTTTLSNTSGSTVTFSSITPGGNYGVYPYTTTCNFSGGTLASGSTCTITTPFLPTTLVGIDAATLSVAYTGASGSPIVLNLTGTAAGVAAVAQVHLDTASAE